MKRIIEYFTAAGLTAKLVGTLLCFALVPTVLVALVVYWGFQEIRDQAANRFQVAAEAIADKTDRNLFERYGDVQAFGLNRALYNRASWYQEGERNEIVRVLNQYVQ